VIADRGERLAEYLARMRGDAQAAAGDRAVAAIRSAVTQTAAGLERVSNALLERAAREQLADLEMGAAAYLRFAGLAGSAWMWRVEGTRRIRVAPSQTRNGAILR
jgi:hypothetical protein